MTFNGKGDVVVAVNGRRWILNPKCIMPAPEEIPSETEEGGRGRGGGKALSSRGHRRETLSSGGVPFRGEERTFGD